MHRHATISAALLACALGAAEGTPVPVVNGDFEAGAKGWENGPQLSSEHKRGGGKSLLLAKGHVFQSLGGMVPVQAGRDYRVRAWVRTQDCAERAVGICAMFRGKDGKGVVGGWIEGARPVYAMDQGRSPVLAVAAGTADWSELVADIPAGQVPAGAAFLHLYLRKDLAGDGPGTAWFDDIAVEELPAGTVASGPILKNGGFEQDRSGWWGDGRWSVVAEGAGEGSRCLRVESGFACQDKRPVVGGRRYKVAMRIRSEGAPEGALFAQVSFRGPGVDAGWYGPLSANGEPAVAVSGGTHGWQDVATVIEAPAGANQILLYLRKAGGSAGAAFYDQISIVPTDEPPTARAPHRGPIIANGGFEAGKAPWWGSGSWEVVAGAGVGGGAALRVDTGFACQDRRPVEGRRNYRISLRVKSDGCDANAVFVQTSYRSAAGKELGGWQGPLRWRNEAAVMVGGGTHDWQEHAIVVQAPPGAAQMLLYLRKQDGPGSAWYDDVAVEATDEQAFTVADRRAAELRGELLPAAAAGADAPAALRAAIALGRGDGGPLELGAAGAVAARVHVAGAGDAVQLGAAKELNALLARIVGGAAPPVSHDANPLSGPLLVVGRAGPLGEALGAGIDWPALGEDGFVIRSLGRHLLVSGNTARGTMYAVNWLLDRHLGVRWLAPGVTHVPARADLALPRLDVRQVPRFAYREVLSHEGSDPAFAAHNLMNGRSHGPSYGTTAPEIDVWDHSWMAKGGSADFWELLDIKNTKEKHPQWFTGGQVAMMDAEMRAAMAREVIERLTVHPDYTRIWYNIWQKDWGWDMDAASRAFAAKHGGHPSAPRLDMMIDIAAQVRAVLPGARFAMQAYSWGYTPPEGMTVPDHILVFPMTIHVDYGTPLNAGRNERLGADMVGWTKLAKNAMVWDHIANWAGFIQPTPNIFPIGDSIRWLAQQPGLHGYFCEGNWNSAGSEFGALRAWLIARLTWDPSQDPRALVGEWCDLYYGQAGAEVSRYIDLMHESAAKTRDVLGQRYTPDIAMYSFDFVTAADALFDRAEAAVAGDDERLRRVRHARMPIDHLILLRRAEFAAAAAARGRAWDPGTAARRARFDQAVVDNTVTQYLQGGKIAELQAALDIERTVARPDPQVAGLAAGDWADIQDISFMRFGDAATVADPAASDGAAIRMGGRSSTWAIQLQVQHLPKDGRWDLYAAVRVDAEPGHDDEPVVRIGAAPPMGLFATATGKEMADGAYHLVKVPGGPYHWDDSTGMKTFFSNTFYVQSPAKPWIAGIYLDRFIAVRATGK